MYTFQALYRGHTIGDAKLVIASADAALIADFAARLLGQQGSEEHDPVVHTLEEGRRGALRAVLREIHLGE